MHFATHNMMKNVPLPPPDECDGREARLDVGTDVALLGGAGSRMVWTMFSISKADVPSDVELSEKTCSSVLILAEKRIMRRTSASTD